jgi:hypothetical protein
MTQVKLPIGWDEERVRKVAAVYDTQSEEDALAEDELAFASAETVMSVPHELVAQVRELIARNQK